LSEGVFLLQGSGARTVKIRLKLIISILFICSCTLSLPCQGLAELVIQAKTACAFQLLGYDGLDDIAIFNGSLSAGDSQHVQTGYTGLAMLIFSGGQQYPLILGSKSSIVTIIRPDQVPSFTAGDENQLLYKLLSDDVPVDNVDSFAGLMIQGKQLLDSSSTIKTVNELHGKKREFQEFLQHNYQDLSHSDLVRRLIGQYFMMHEYVSYNREGSPASDIQLRYRREVLSGVKTLLTLLQDQIPENELLNYCVGLHYNRGMVTLASFIADKFENIAYCGNDNRKMNDLPDNLKLVFRDGSTAGTVGALKREKIVSVVSSDCPVSMVRTVIKARELAGAKNQGDKQLLIVIPLEKLSEKHRAMSRNVSGGAMLFVDDKSWVENNLQNIRLPLIQDVPME
jgi:hypothetical protein